MRVERLAWIVTVSTLVAAACSGTDGTGPDEPPEVAGDESPGATETNVARVHCTDDDECPDTLRCVPFTEGDSLGACVGDAGTSDGGE